MRGDAEQGLRQLRQPVGPTEPGRCPELGRRARSRTPHLGAVEPRGHSVPGQLDRRSQAALEPDPSEPPGQLAPSGDRSGNVDRPRAELSRRLGGGRPRGRPGGVDPVHRARRVAHDREQIAADPGRVGLGHAQHSGRADRRVDRAPPFSQHVQAGERRQRLAGGDHRTRRDRRGAGRGQTKRHATSGARRTEPLGADPAGVMPDVDQPAGGDLDERVRTAYVHARLRRRRPGRPRRAVPGRSGRGAPASRPAIRG